MIAIGHKQGGEKFGVDLPVLLKTRLLIQASSGGGKSWTIRKILEQTYGKVQQIVLDSEDDFSTLREKYDYVLAGKGGDIAVSVRTAELLARKILELRADVIVNLYELRQHERIRFVKMFLDAMVNCPKELWHPTMIILDEAHMYAPEKTKSESLGAVIDMESRGRKRGFCLIPATQRLAKLHKDVAAECQNKLIGVANMDIDRKRAAEELGFTEKKKILSLRDLKPGQFYAVGPAFDRGVNQIRIGKVKTTHFEAGRISKMKAPVPTAKVGKILSKLTDLPQEAERELNDKKSMMARIRELERELRTTKARVEVKTKVETVIDKKATEAAIKKSKRVIARLVNSEVERFTKHLNESLKKIAPIAAAGLETMAISVQKAREVNAGMEMASKVMRSRLPPAPRPDAVKRNTTYDNGEFGRCERAILKFLAMREGKAFTKVQIGVMTEYSPKSGAFNNSISKLATAGLVERSRDQVRIIDVPRAIEVLGDEYVAPSHNALEGWLSKLGKCERMVYEQLLKDQDTSYTKEEIGRDTGYSHTSGAFNNSISKICTLGLAQRLPDGRVRFNPEVLGL